MVESKKPVIIVGAGPVGMLTALRLGREGISTVVLEAHETLLPTTRAMVYMPVINPVLRGLGLIDIISEEAYLNHTGVCWRDIDGKILGRLPLIGEGNEFGGTFQIGQARMNELILKEIKKCPSVDMRFGLRCVGIEDTPSSDFVKVMAHTKGLPDDDVIIEGSYVLGTDGNNSSVRRIMCIPFEGYTFSDFKMITTDLLFDFSKEFGYTPLNFFVHPTEWGVVAYAGQDGDGSGTGPNTPQWRVAFVEPCDMPSGKEQIYARAADRVSTFLKGRKDFSIVRAESYWLHQRCAAASHKGRVMLAGDALHSNNPLGGLGLTGGILDAFVYGNAITRVVKGGEPATLLIDCANSRRDAWMNATAVGAMANLHRVGSFTEEHCQERDEFFHRLNNDPAFPAIVRRGMDQMMPDTFEKKSEGNGVAATQLDEIVSKSEGVAVH